MHERTLGIIYGTSIGFIGGISTDKIIEVIVLSLLGGFLGAVGGTLWRVVKKACSNKNTDTKK